MSIFKMKKAQSTAEYVIILGLVIGAVIAMQTYVKRGLQGRIREITDTVDNAGEVPGQGKGGVAGGVVKFTAGKQYEPDYLSSFFETERSSKEKEEMLVGGGVNKGLSEDEKVTQKKGGYQKIKAPQ